MKESQRGQVLLIIILVMTVALTVGLSVATRTVTNLRTTAEEENSQRAFSAAEAGVEQALQNNIANSGTFTNNTSYQTSLSALSGIEFLLNNGTPILKDNPEDIWLSTYPGYTNPWSGNVTIYWGNASDTCTTSEATNSMAALEIILISGTKANPQLTHFPVDPCALRSNTNNFEVIPAGGKTIEGKALAYKKTIVVASGLLIRVVPLYAPTLIGVAGCDGFNANCNTLPSQGTVITAVGTSDTTQRKVISFKENPKLPIQLFPFILFSPK